MSSFVRHLENAVSRGRRSLCNPVAKERLQERIADISSADLAGRDNGRSPDSETRLMRRRWFLADMSPVGTVLDLVRVRRALDPIV